MIPKRAPGPPPPRRPCARCVKSAACPWSSLPAAPWPVHRWSPQPAPSVLDDVDLLDAAFFAACEEDEVARGEPHRRLPPAARVQVALGAGRDLADRDARGDFRERCQRDGEPRRSEVSACSAEVSRRCISGTDGESQVGDLRAIGQERCAEARELRDGRGRRVRGEAGSPRQPRPTSCDRYPSVRREARNSTVGGQLGRFEQLAGLQGDGLDDVLGRSAIEQREILGQRQGIVAAIPRDVCFVNRSFDPSPNPTHAVRRTRGCRTRQSRHFWVSSFQFQLPVSSSDQKPENGTASRMLTGNR